MSTDEINGDAWMRELKRKKNVYTKRWGDYDDCCQSLADDDCVCFVNLYKMKREVFLHEFN